MRLVKDKRTGELRTATKQEVSEINEILEKHTVTKRRKINGKDKEIRAEVKTN